MKSFESWKFHFCYSFPLHKHRSLCNTSRIFAVTQWDRRCFQRWVFRFNYLWNFEIRTPGSLLKQLEKWLLIVLLIFLTFFCLPAMSVYCNSAIEWRKNLENPLLCCTQCHLPTIGLRIDQVNRLWLKRKPFFVRN